MYLGKRTEIQSERRTVRYNIECVAMLQLRQQSTNRDMDIKRSQTQ